MNQPNMQCEYEQKHPHAADGKSHKHTRLTQNYVHTYTTSGDLPAGLAAWDVLLSCSGGLLLGTLGQHGGHKCKHKHDQGEDEARGDGHGEEAVQEQGLQPVAGLQEGLQQKNNQNTKEQEDRERTWTMKRGNRDRAREHLKLNRLTREVSPHYRWW